ncbi:dihydrolipoyllysine-residue acetyltransferase [Nitrosomonas oligotropha]|uniref:Acetyltransferase component of pyruvate dehydrogenase complex n=1 Tax=Nitrosomonas oligotropha TaxID=42354 RepID=A0A1H8TEJ6_9PROT|nr:dihydrolipoyllysine-residue acetyltransferase [Nitrosomonas oligotropha]SDX27815.1 pyruvate dehydrogenase E2 component (dihydrolipoamide acetyltransferase) [Nitrosomonas oligotropha]SEO89347.1 pyruvate dehydrogenase E2 component (dihydrolipoamide acetyltransferase) [Nitrosomonas oligotropha]
MAELKKVLIPDIGDFKEVPVIEVLVKAGDRVKAEDSLITLESDKATIEIPAPYPGLVKEILVKPGDKVSQGSSVLTLEVSDDNRTETLPEVSGAVAVQKEIAPQPQPQHDAKLVANHQPQNLPQTVSTVSNALSKAHASPSIRRFARELGVNLDLITGSGPKHRILKEDVQAYVKAELSKSRSTGTGAALNLLPWPQVNFAKFGPVELKPLMRIKQISGANLHRNWVMIPHVTQFDEADITDLEALRKESKDSGKENRVKLTLLAFLMKALIAPLKKFPEFNASLDNDSNGEANLIIKHYYHLGFAVDTANGLVVPVIKDVDQKGIITIAEELARLSALAREGKLKPTDMQGASFTISSLGGIGGTAFTPIINAPEVAILGISKASIKPVYRDHQFVPRLMLPLSLSYDHRVIDGATAARFTTHLSEVLTDMRLALL